MKATVCYILGTVLMADSRSLFSTTATNYQLQLFFNKLNVWLL